MNADILRNRKARISSMIDDVNCSICGASVRYSVVIMPQQLYSDSAKYNGLRDVCVSVCVDCVAVVSAISGATR